MIKILECGHICQQLCHEVCQCEVCSDLEEGFEDDIKDGNQASRNEKPVLLDCGHIQKGSKCSFKCTFKYPNCNHHCRVKCGDDHSHEKCLHFEKYSFPCGHVSPRRKMCWETIIWNCQARIPVKLNCGHTVKKPCGENNIKCYLPCQKVLLNIT